MGLLVVVALGSLALLEGRQEAWPGQDLLACGASDACSRVSGGSVERLLRVLGYRSCQRAGGLGARNDIQACDDKCPSPAALLFSFLWGQVCCIDACAALVRYYSESRAGIT